MNTFRQSEIDDPPSCLEAAYERQAIMNGSSIVTATFSENQKYMRTGVLEDYLQGTDWALANTFDGGGWHLAKSKGTKFDDEKPRYELIPPEALGGVAQVFTMGARKYGDRNWESGIAYGRIFSACMRHLWAWWKGESVDPESGLSHLHHAACNIMMLQNYEARKMSQWDDRVTAP